MAELKFKLGDVFVDKGVGRKLVVVKKVIHIDNVDYIEFEFVCGKVKYHFSYLTFIRYYKPATEAEILLYG